MVVTDWFNLSLYRIAGYVSMRGMRFFGGVWARARSRDDICSRGCTVTRLIPPRIVSRYILFPSKLVSDADFGPLSPSACETFVPTPYAVSFHVMCRMAPRTRLHCAERVDVAVALAIAIRRGPRLTCFTRSVQTQHQDSHLLVPKQLACRSVNPSVLGSAASRAVSIMPPAGSMLIFPTPESIGKASTYP